MSREAEALAGMLGDREQREAQETARTVSAAIGPALPCWTLARAQRTFALGADAAPLPAYQHAAAHLRQLIAAGLWRTTRGGIMPKGSPVAEEHVRELLRREILRERTYESGAHHLYFTPFTKSWALLVEQQALEAYQRTPVAAKGQ